MKDPPQGDQKEKQRGSHATLESQSDSKSVALSKQKVSSGRAHSSMALHETINAKHNLEGDQNTKLHNRITTTPVKTIILARLVAYADRSTPREPISSYQTPFSMDIEGMNPPKKFTPPKFTLYDDKSDPRSHVSHVR